MRHRTRRIGALAYLRRSTDRQEISLTTQLDWALVEAARHAVRLDASSADLEHMQAARLSAYKGLRLDDGISGADLDAPRVPGADRQTPWPTPRSPTC